jgi:serine phosphatase RsbU (regulator of sigma subunit)
MEVGSFGPIVGAFGGSVFTVEELEIRPMDLIVLYTDGLTDARRGHERLGTARLQAVLEQASSPADAVERIRAMLERFEDGPQADDTALVALMRETSPSSSRIRGTGPHELPLSEGWVSRDPSASAGTT